MLEYRDGDHRAICDRCGFKYYASQLTLEWTGLRVCHKCWEPRHPQDFVRGIPDKQTPPWTRPQPPDVFRPLGGAFDPAEFDESFDGGFGFEDILLP